MLKTIKGQQINHQPNPVQTAHINLIVAIIEQAVKEEGMEYLNSVDGKYWLDLLGIDNKRVLKLLEKRLDKF